MQAKLTETRIRIDALPKRLAGTAGANPPAALAPPAPVAPPPAAPPAPRDSYEAYGEEPF